MKNLKDLTRQNIWSLAPYSSARNEYSGHVAHVFLDANENPYNNPYNRYPDPLQQEVKERIAQIKCVPAECIFLGNGSDEAIDLVYRCFCEPGTDNVVAIEPTYGMYKVCADINDVEYRPVRLNADYDFAAQSLLEACDAKTKVIWLCSPNNPTGNDLNRDEIEKVLTKFDGIVVIGGDGSFKGAQKLAALGVDRVAQMAEPHCAQHDEQGMGMCCTEIGHGIRLKRDYRHLQQGEISLQHQQIDTRHCPRSLGKHIQCPALGQFLA